MAGSTPQFGYAYFDFGDTLDSPLNVRKEIERFTLIDRQLYGMSQIFGDGVVSGWEIKETNGLGVQILAGIGLYQGKALESIFPTSIEDLLPDSLLYVYAIPQPTTEQDRTVDFVVSPVQSTFGLLIGTVTTGATNIQSIDVTVRTQVGFRQIIAEEIAHHRHNGSSPKIDLTQEVQGSLPSSRMADIDASKVSGRLPASVLPTIDHSSLKNTGTLTHPQIDSVLNAIQKDNIALLGEVASVNLMKMIAHFKYLDVDVDKYFVNEMCIIPGVSPDTFIDFDNSTAVINKSSHCISGIPELPIDFASLNEIAADANHNNFQIVSIDWKTDTQFRDESSTLSNIAIGGGAKLSVDTVFDRVLEDFEGVVGKDVPSFSASLTDANTTHIIYDSSKAQGDTSGKFETINSRTAEFTKTFTQAQDWTAYDQLIVFVKNFTATHAGVTIRIMDDSDVEIASYILLTTDEITTQDNLNTGGFSKKQFDISTFARNKVKKIVMSTDSITNEQEAFFVDTIYLRSSEFLLPSGNIRFRKSTTAPVIFNSIDFEATIPAGTDIQVRVRVAASLNDLPNATFSSLLQSGESFAIVGTVCEIDITLLSNAAKTASPTLTSVTLNLLAPSTSSGLTIASAESWLRGTVLSNIDVVDTGNPADTVIQMKQTNVGNFYFVNESQVSELDPNGVPFVGINAQGMPMSPVQGETAIHPPTFSDDPYGLKRRDIRGLYKPLSVYRLDSGNYMIADTHNDRAMEITSDGTFVRGWGSHNYDTNADSLYALSSVYNPRLGVLFVTFSKTTDIRNFDFTKIRLIVGSSTELRLSNEADKLRFPDGTIITDRSPGTDGTNPPANLIGDTERILTVFLSEDKRKILDSTTSAVSCAISTNIKDRIECFIGDFTYFGSFGINRPIFANMSGEETVLIANASILSESSKVVKTFPIIEFTRRIGELVDGQPVPLGLTFTYDQLLFSDIMIGGLQVINSITADGQANRKLLIAGLKFNQEAAAAASADATAPADVFSVTLSPLDDKKMLLFTGVVRLVDMDSQLVSFEYQCSDGKYPSDAFIDDNGNVVVAESTFTSQGGRIVTLDVNGIGDGSTPPIIKLIEGGVYTKIWDIRNLKNNHIYVST
jgi:hypothetical protein